MYPNPEAEKRSPSFLAPHPPRPSFFLFVTSSTTGRCRCCGSNSCAGFESPPLSGPLKLRATSSQDFPCAVGFA